MKKKKILAVLLILLFLGLAVGAAQFMTVDKKEEQEAMRLIYLKLDQPNCDHIFVDQGGGLFVVTIPEDAIYDQAGKKIGKEDLQTGDILDIYGNGMVLMSYPGQYPGVEKMEIVGHETDKKLLEKYLSHANEFCGFLPDGKERPTMTIRFDVGETADYATYSSRGLKARSYHWTYETEEGKENTLEKDLGEITSWERIYVLTFPKEEKNHNGHLLEFSQMPDQVQMVCYDSEGNTSQVELTKEALGYRVMDLKPNCRYQLTATYEKSKESKSSYGTVVYGFKTGKRLNSK